VTLHRQWQRRHRKPLGETEAGPVTGRVEEGEVESGWVAVLSHGMSCKHSRTVSGNEANEDWVVHDGAIVTPLINQEIDTSDENEVWLIDMHTDRISMFVMRVGTVINSSI
jgi:hypothetical protein